MTAPPTPDVEVSTEFAASIARACSELGDLKELEASAIQNRWEPAPEELQGWQGLRAAVLAAWRSCDHVVLRGLELTGEGASLILAASLLGRSFRPYRGGKIVKHFTMSPWTQALSHTLAEGHFHTDLNTAAEPPRITAIQCVVADPGKPAAGDLRVARVTDILRALAEEGLEATIGFLCDSVVCMVDDASPEAWCGKIIENQGVRFHPETLRAGQQRLGGNPTDLEEHLGVVKRAALTVSRPIQLGVGEALLVSNRRALHYRGACTVRFRQFPRDFESRSVYVLHLMDEPA